MELKWPSKVGLSVHDLGQGIPLQLRPCPKGLPALPGSGAAKPSVAGSCTGHLSVHLTWVFTLH